MPHNFWMINCNERNFNITRDLGFTRQALKAEYRRKVQRVEPGDRIIYYVTGIRVFTATVTVTEGYREVGASNPWENEGKTGWPYRIGIKPAVTLPPEQYIDAGLIAYRLEYIRKWPPEDWHLAFQGNLHLLSKGDFFLLETEMRKLRYGREATLRQVELELAEEAERNGAQRERRRRSTETRAVARPPTPPPSPSSPSPSPSLSPSSRRPPTESESEHDSPAPDRPDGPARRPTTAADSAAAATTADENPAPPASGSGNDNAGARSRRHRRPPRGPRAGGRPARPTNDRND